MPGIHLSKFLNASTTPLRTFKIASTKAIITLRTAKRIRILAIAGPKATIIKSVIISKTNLIISKTAEKISFNDCQASANAPDCFTALAKATTNATITKIQPIIGTL